MIHLPFRLPIIQLWDRSQTSFGSDDNDTTRRDRCGPSDKSCTGLLAIENLANMMENREIRLWSRGDLKRCAKPSAEEVRNHLGVG
jgi:hypothetical protein